MVGGFSLYVPSVYCAVACRVSWPFPVSRGVKDKDWGLISCHPNNDQLRVGF